MPRKVTSNFLNSAEFPSYIKASIDDDAGLVLKVGVSHRIYQYSIVYRCVEFGDKWVCNSASKCAKLTFYYVTMQPCVKLITLN